jgi:hypothetical protein
MKPAASSARLRKASEPALREFRKIAVKAAQIILAWHLEHE